MKQKISIISLAIVMGLGMVGCSTKPTDPIEPKSEIKEFGAEYEMKGTTSSGKPKNDTFIFSGETEDGIITKLTFDVIRNKGQEGAYSKKDLMGYLMNISDAQVDKDGDNFKLTKLTSYGYDTAFDEGSAAQFMVSASIDAITDTTTFKDLTFTNDAQSTPDNIVSVPMDKALIAYKYVADEAKIENFSEETLVKDILSAHGLYDGTTFVEGTQRISFAGYHGGRSYGEQIDAIAAYILEKKMTLEDVYEMFKTVNQGSTPIEERDVISGATITFVGDFQRMAYVAIHGELFEGVLTHTQTDDQRVIEVVTQGYGGEIETHVTFDNEGKITDIKVRDAQETAEIGATLTADGSDFINALLAGQGKADVVAGATVTSNSLIKAVQLAIEFNSNL